MDAKLVGRNTLFTFEDNERVKEKDSDLKIDGLSSFKSSGRIPSNQ